MLNTQTIQRVPDQGSQWELFQWSRNVSRSWLPSSLCFGIFPSSFPQHHWWESYREIKQPADREKCFRSYFYISAPSQSVYSGHSPICQQESFCCFKVMSTVSAQRKGRPLRGRTRPPFLTLSSSPSVLSAGSTGEFPPAWLWDPMGIWELLPVYSKSPQEPEAAFPGQLHPQGSSQCESVCLEPPAVDPRAPDLL